MAGLEAAARTDETTSLRRRSDSCLERLSVLSGQIEVLTLSGTGKTLILSIQKDKEDGSEEDCIEVKRHTSSLHRRVQGGS
ncbi:MAG: hypothetical protein NTX48_01600, partial [Planctomycetales bacterium]|nr:hypothetical protein [Planctomycetales bacterium]